MSDISHIPGKYQSRVFWWVFLSSIIAVSIISYAMYQMTANASFSQKQEELKTIATRTAGLIPVKTHENLTDREQMDDEDFELLELYLQSVISANPEIDDIYTLRPTSDSDIYTFVVSGQETRDKNGDGVIDESELKAELGEEYDISGSPQIAEGLKGPAVDKQITYDKWGAWLSGYAPLRDENDKAVAVLGVDFSADTISEQRHEIFNRIIIYLAVLFPTFLLLVSFLVSRVLTRPMRIVVKAIDRVLHGDYDFHLDAKRKSERPFVMIFNNLIDAIGKGRHHRDTEEKHKDHEI